MNNKAKLKLAIDLIMSILLLSLMNLDLTGNYLHEIIGLVIIALLLSHLLVNKQWLLNVGSMLRNKANIKLKIKLIINTISGFVMAVALLSGIMISQYIFPSIASDSSSIWYTIHTASSWLSFGIIIVHCILHLGWIKAIIKKLFHKAPPLITFMARALAIIVAAATIFLMLNSNLGDVLASSKSNQTNIKSDMQADQSTINAAGSNNNSIETVTESSEPTISLSEYLSNFYCTGCHRHCPLSNPRCGRSNSLVEQKTALYYETYVEE